MKLTFVDLFAGVGMARMGMEQAGFECVYTCEFDKHKRKEYEIIHGNEPEGCDIRDVRAADIPRSDVWFFGAPCQDFSIAGLRKGLGGDRSSLISEVFRLIEEKGKDKPEWLVYENVKGMLSSNDGWDFLSILLGMEELGYDIEWQTLNTKNFGLPQNRERVYTIGHLRKYGSKQILPITSTNGKDCIPKVIGGVGEKDSNNNKQWKQQNRIYDNNISISVTTKFQPFYLDNNFRIRKLTPKECMRLQGVPDEYTDRLIQAGISDSQIYKAAGDGLSVPIAKEIGERIRKTYYEENN